MINMTFEEFFKKKKIDLDALEKGDPALFFEFKNHFEQMGEKSFDHTKKYWFNKLRLQYHLAPEIKTEKVKIENPLAEQTVTDSLVESTLQEPRPAAASKFQAAPIPERPAGEHSDKNDVKEAPKGFTPRFKANVTKPVENPTGSTAEEKPAEQPVPVDKPTVGFTPRFKAGVTKPAEDTVTPPAEEKEIEQPVPADKPKIGFTPRFKAGVTKSAEDAVIPPPAEEKKIEQPAPADKPKIGFTPRFKAGVTKPAEDPVTPPKIETEEEKKSEEAPAENKPKIGFTPRFKASAPPKRQPPSAEE